MARLVLACFLFQAFLASGALAFSAPDGDATHVQICSASGLKWVALPPSSLPPPFKAEHQEHCALCGMVAALPETVSAVPHSITPQHLSFRNQVNPPFFSFRDWQPPTRAPPSFT